MHRAARHGHDGLGEGASLLLRFGPLVVLSFLAAGVAQINFVIPAGISLGQAPVQIGAGDRSSYPTTQIALRP